MLLILVHPGHAKNISSPERMLPLFVNYISKCIKYWVKIIGMNDNFFLFQATPAIKCKHVNLNDYYTMKMVK